MVSLNYLQTFIEFVNSGNMSLASKNLGLTQPAVSKQLKALEESYGQPLFIMSGTKKTLSPFGRALYESCSDALTKLVEQSRGLEKYNQIRRVKIAGREIVLETLIKRIDHFPSGFEMIFCDTQEAIKKVSKHEVDFAVSYEVPHSSDLIAKKLFTNTSSLAFSKKHFSSLGKKNAQSLSQNDLLENPILSYRKDDPSLAQLCKLKNISLSQLTISMVAPNWSFLKKAAIQGHGIAILPSEFAEDDQLHTIEFEGSIRFDYHLIYPRHVVKNELGKDWIKAIFK